MVPAASQTLSSRSKASSAVLVVHELLLSPAVCRQHLCNRRLSFAALHPLIFPQDLKTAGHRIFEHCSTRLVLAILIHACGDEQSMLAGSAQKAALPTSVVMRCEGARAGIRMRCQSGGVTVTY
ncbi:hypothetical protein Tco_0064570 [Tanacetum coccineum]